VRESPSLVFCVYVHRSVRKGGERRRKQPEKRGRLPDSPLPESANRRAGRKTVVKEKGEGAGGFAPSS